MLGSFLEISVHAPEIRESLEFYEALGFRQATVGETWSHPYAVVTDGRLLLGLHGYEFDSPALTWSRANIPALVADLDAAGIRPEFAKLKDDEFNEAGFVDPDGQMVAVLEARTYSPVPLDADLSGRLGRFLQFRYAVRSVEDSTAFWEPLGFVAHAEGDGEALLVSDGINIGLYEARRRSNPALVFEAESLGAAAEAVQALDLELEPAPGSVWRAGRAGVVRAPEGTPLVVVEADD